jgi:hypothetical protein
LRRVGADSDALERSHAARLQITPPREPAAPVAANGACAAWKHERENELALDLQLGRCIARGLSG